MQVSTIYHGTLITGVVVQQTSHFIEVAITSPFSKILTRRYIPKTTDGQTECPTNAFKEKYVEMLVELYEVAR